MRYSKTVFNLGIMIMIVALIFTTSSRVFAQRGSQKKGLDRSSNDNIDLLTFDKNGDGKLARSEFPGFDMVWIVLDQNEDGFVDTSDINTPGPQGTRFIKLFDKNGDGKIERSEFPNDEVEWDFFDENDDGFIDVKEAWEQQSTQVFQLFVPTEGN